MKTFNKQLTGQNTGISNIECSLKCFPDMNTQGLQGQDDQGRGQGPSHFPS